MPEVKQYLPGGIKPAGLTEILMVCTANTCRSPLAAVIMRNELARKLNSTVENLPANGYLVRSAGPWADRGEDISTNSKIVLSQLGYPVPGRGARELTGDLSADAEYIYAMTQWHQREVLAITPQVEGRIQLLDSRGKDIPDPIGGELRVYEKVGTIIQGCVRERIEEIWADRLNKGIVR